MKENRLYKDYIVRFVPKNGVFSAKIGSIAVVMRGRVGKNPYVWIKWVDENALGQMDGGYRPEDFEYLGKLKKGVKLIQRAVKRRKGMTNERPDTSKQSI